MFVELHILQNFAPSNLNRDDTGSPKDCEFGGHRRARISSQCLKRAIRRDSNFAELLSEGGGIRTRRLITEVAKRVARQDPPPEDVVKVVAEVFKQGGIELSTAQRGQTKVGEDTSKLVLFVSKPAVDEMAKAFADRWVPLTRGDRQAASETIQELAGALVRSVRAPDIALFGRMVEIDAKTPFGKLQLGLDAACQVAHAISTHRAAVEFDFYTAVDDIPGADAGAAMMDTVQFNSACFYRYANVDLAQLRQNLGGDEELAHQTLAAFVQASIVAVPTGKQNSMAAQNPPSLVFAVVRDHGLWSLANAFVRPVVADGPGDLVENSIRALDRYWGQLVGMYGDREITRMTIATLHPECLTVLAPCVVKNVDQLVEKVMAAVSFAPATKGGQA